MKPRCPLLSIAQSRKPHQYQCRFSSTASSQLITPSTVPPSKWLSHTRSRIGKCISFGLSREQVASASGICKTLAREWRELVAGREGFLTAERSAGLRGHKVVWGEMDSMGHVNNVTYVRYAESARVNWINNFGKHVDPEHKQDWSGLLTPKGNGLILRSIKVDYKFPITYPDTISVFHKLTSSPSTSPSSAFTLSVAIVSERHQRVAARCEEDIVVYDYKMGQKTEIPSYMRDVFEQTWSAQQREKERIERSIGKIDEAVGKLEKDSWDRPDAKEDLGGGNV